MDEITRIPLDLVPQNEQEKRWLYRIDGVGVRPLARDRGFGDCSDRRSVVGSYRPGTVSGWRERPPKVARRKNYRSKRPERALQSAALLWMNSKPCLEMQTRMYKNF